MNKYDKCDCAAKGSIRCDMCMCNIKDGDYEDPSRPGLYLCEVIVKDGAVKDGAYLYDRVTQIHNGECCGYSDIEVVRCKEIVEADV